MTVTSTASVGAAAAAAVAETPLIRAETSRVAATLTSIATTDVVEKEMGGKGGGGDEGGKGGGGRPGGGGDGG